MKENIIEVKSFNFAKRIIKLYKYLISEKKEFILSKQLLRSGTSIGANIREARYGASKADFKNKLKIALKEASEYLTVLPSKEELKKIVEEEENNE